MRSAIEEEVTMQYLSWSSIVTPELSGRNFKVICGYFAQSLFMFAILCAMLLLAIAATNDPMRFRGGLRNSNGARSLSNQRLQKVIESLRYKTGFLEMRFDDAGFLTLGDRRRLVGGSATARELLLSAVDGDKIFELEAHDSSPGVAFARIGSATSYIKFETSARIEMMPIQLDFSDFAQLRGEREVLVAFDIGFAILHELAHGALRLKDSVARNRLGDCDEHINLIRRELGLPERLNYSPIIHPKPMALATTGDAELIFVRVNRDKTMTFYLRWDAMKVASSESLSTRAR
jgi:hypothetical protein